MEFLALNAFTAVIYDQRGHGATAGSIDKLGYMSDVDNFQAMVLDAKMVYDRIKEIYPDKDIYLMGHSMGSFISQRFIEMYPNTIKGLILSGTNITSSSLYGIGRLIAKKIVKKHGRKYISKTLDKMSFGSYNNKFKPTRTDYDWLSVNQENVNKYIKDEYCGTIFSASYFMDLLYGFKLISSDYQRIQKDLPIFMFSGSDDPVGNFGKGVKKLQKKYLHNNINNVKLLLYKDGRHEMLNEDNYQEVYDNILKWLNNH